jgi:hypothetical protein
MSSAVRHQPLRVRTKAQGAPRSISTEVHAEPSTSLLASRAFWLGGVASIGLWTLVAVALAHLF